MTRTAEYEIPDYLARRESAKTNERMIQVVAILLAITFVGVASLFVSPIDKLRTEYQLTLDPESTRGLPPAMALMTKAGTFRALAIDFAFIRLERLKQDDKYYELDKLSSLVCKLAPRFPSVWKYCAWNEAYNISVAQYSPEARWYWVRNGIELLRQQGIPYNNKSIGLYRELAWIYWHKVGDFLDDQHWYYKKQLAIEMERILGAPSVDTSDDAVIGAFAAIADAPTSLDDLTDHDPEVVDLIDQIGRLGLTPDDSLLMFVARYLRNTVQIRDVLKDLEEDDFRSKRQARVELLSNPKLLAARDRLLACLRNIAIREKLKMDPKWMLKLMHDYGPIDWRSPYMHSLYWATLGDMITKGQLNLDENDSMNLVRFIFFSLDQSVKRGRIVFEPDFDKPGNSYIELLPDSRFIPYAQATYLKFGKEQFGDDPRFIPGTSGPNYMGGHFNLMADWIRQLYTEGGSKNLKLAKQYYAYLRKYNREKDGRPKAQYLQPLAKFVLKDFFDDLTGFKTANMTIGSWIRRSLKYLSLGDADASITAMDIATRGWKHYTTGKGVDPGNTGRRSLPPLADLRVGAVIGVMTAPRIALIHKVRLWRALELPTRQAAYDRILPFFTELAPKHDPPIIVERALPEPPGMEEYRKRRPAQDTLGDNVDLGQKSW